MIASLTRIITNTEAKTSVRVSKAWANADGTASWPAGAAVTVALKNGETEVASRELTAAETAYTFGNLPAKDAEATTSPTRSPRPASPACPPTTPPPSPARPPRAS